MSIVFHVEPDSSFTQQESYGRTGGRESLESMYGAYLWTYYYKVIWDSTVSYCSLSRCQPVTK